MNDGAFTSTLVLAAIMALTGLACGLAYFRSLQWTVDSVVGGGGWLAPVALTLARIAGIVAVLAIVTRFGPIPLLACFLGVLAARAVALRSAKRAG